jgi:hypothetical protein
LRVIARKFIVLASLRLAFQSLAGKWRVLFALKKNLSVQAGGLPEKPHGAYSRSPSQKQY